MPGPPLLAGIDIGTTGTRCVVFDLDGQRVSSAYAGYEEMESDGSLVQQSVPVMLDTTRAVCRQATDDSAPAGKIVAVGVSAQMSTTCPVLPSGEVLRPLISWKDARARTQMEWITKRCPPSKFKAITGAPPAPQLVAPTMLWLKEHEPEVFERAAVWPQLQGLVLHALGVEGFYLDEAEAFAYGLWDISQRRWSGELLDLTEINSRSLGTTVRAGTPVGTVSADAARRSGFAMGTTLCVGAGDQICEMVGMGAIDGGIATSTIGTGGSLETTVFEPRTDLDGLTTLNHAVGDRWALFAPTLAAAGAYKWFRDQLGDPEAEVARGAGTSSYDLLDELASLSPPGSNGVMFLPYLNSAGAPHWNPFASGAFLGLTQDSVRADLVRAVLEGVVHEMLGNLLRLARVGLDPGVIRAGGGGARSELWTRIQADMYGVPVQRLQESEPAALGAAMLAGIGSGLFASFDEATEAMVHTSQTFDPDTRRHARYGELHETYEAAYNALDQSVFELLAANRR